MSQPNLLTLGKISGVFGVKGWVKVSSHTEQRDSILGYSPWWLQVGGQWKTYTVKNGQVQGKAIIAQLDGVDDRDQAQALVGATIAIEHHQLKPLRQNEYYWADLLEMEVITTLGFRCGRVQSLFETGSNDVMVVQGERERLIPWIMDDVIVSVDLANGQIIVNWDPDF